MSFNRSSFRAVRILEHSISFVAGPEKKVEHRGRLFCSLSGEHAGPNHVFETVQWCAEAGEPTMSMARVEHHRTHRGDDRIVVQFANKPNRATLDLMRSKGRYRKGPRLGCPPCWYLMCSMEELLEGANQAGCELLTAALTRENEEESVSSPAEANPPNPRHCAACAEDMLGNETSIEHTQQGDCWFSP